MDEAGTVNLQDEILKTTELIKKLSQAEKSINNHQGILESKMEHIDLDRAGNKYQILTNWILDARDEINHLLEFPRRPSYTPFARSITLSPTAKELAERVRKTKIQFHHNKKNLATERKMARELRKQERERQQQLQLQLQAEDAVMQANLLSNKCYSLVTRRYRRCLKTLPKFPLKSLIVMWTEKIEKVSKLVLRDSENLAPTRQTREQLEELQDKTKQFYLQGSNIDKSEFAKYWDSMRCIVNSFAQMEVDLVKENRRHREGYAESERVYKEKELMLKKRWEEVTAKLKILQQEKSEAYKLLSYLYNLVHN